MVKYKAATNFLNALDRIPKLMEQYKTQNAVLEKDLPTLREIVGGTWKKEEELRQLKSEVTVLERKIQLTLAPTQSQGEQTNSVGENMPERSDRVLIVKPNINDDKKMAKGMKM